MISNRPQYIRLEAYDPFDNTTLAAATYPYQPRLAAQSYYSHHVKQLRKFGNLHLGLRKARVRVEFYPKRK